MWLLLIKRRALWCRKRGKGAEGPTKREFNCLSCLPFPAPDTPLSCLKQATKARHIYGFCHWRRVSATDWSSGGACCWCWGILFHLLFPPRGAVSKDGHKNKQDKEKSESWIKGSGSSVFWLQAALINRSLLWKKKKHMYSFNPATYCWVGGFLYFCPYLTIGLVNDVLWYKWPPPTATLSHTTWRFGALGTPIHSEWSDVMHCWTEVWIRCFTLPAVISPKSSAEFTVPSTIAVSSQSHQRQGTRLCCL